MTEARQAARPGLVAHAAEHILYVEGGSDDSLDPRVLSRLFRDTPLRVRPLGAANNIKSAAEALAVHHPNYYFLIDRDHNTPEHVESFWTNFPNPDTHNLLVWRKRELENYFIDPAYIMKSKFLKPGAGEEDIKNLLLKICSKRKFLEAANLALIQIREKAKQKWIELFRGITGFESKDSALGKLKDKETELQARRDQTCKLTDPNHLETLFHEKLETLTGGRDELEFETGAWLEMVNGKKVLNVVVDKCFDVIDASGNRYDGKKSVKLFAEELLNQPLESQPEDFRQLHGMITKRLEAPA